MEEEKSEIINGVDNRLDIKAETILSAAVAIDALKKNKDFSVGANTKIIILTTSSIIYGDILINDDDQDPVLAINNAIAKCRNKFLKDTQNPGDIIVNNSSFIRIKDASVAPISSNNPSKFKILNVFTDQILAFSFGEINFG